VNGNREELINPPLAAAKMNRSQDAKLLAAANVVGKAVAAAWMMRVTTST
jgi:hypothetical protein